MPFVRFSRDKRGYEHIYLVHASSRRGKPTRARVLYWFRSPPGVKVGRQPFDADVRQLLEAQNPELTFDWEKLANTPFPAPDAENWRERRRAERVAKQARLAEQQGEEEDTESAAVADAEQPAAPAEHEASPQVVAAAESVQPAARRRRRRGDRHRRRSAPPSAAPSPDASPSGSTADSANATSDRQPDGE